MTASSPLRSQLSALLPSLDVFSQAKPGQRLELPAFAGSSDALAIARLAGGGRMLVVITANPLDAQRQKRGNHRRASRAEPRPGSLDLRRCA